ncbi:Asparagine synthetase [Xenorhabdus bovienii str. kraussei Quebec]|uniref:asparagine synthase (glutamine-hydrolyzing) n=1 Tax=Xenorhabdus bovienii str. kraussei Quebec TaxID=1398203 RepID=A0A077P7B9_XENBV|nr:asparagine synthase-related protein [Xenorhabdus bovienii]CDH20375.1 Asparagine synthetase [Xenorhabdus bovienii str. kraussei Quebec]
MCGIAGIIGNNPSKKTLVEILSKIEHRGDKQNFSEVFTNNKLAVGTNRLAIVDEEKGKQPKFSECGRYVGVLDGKIYNHVELKNELATTFNFKSDCDTEVCLYAYIKWGKEAVKKLRGMWAFFIYDLKSNNWVVARDPVGIKPFYYSLNHDYLYFCSEVKGIANLDHLEYIKELKPGHFLTKSGEEKFYELNFFKGIESKFVNNDFDALAKVRDELYSCVARMIPNDTKSIACLLSGGIDSSIITKVANDLHPGKVIAYTFTYDETQSPDLKAAKKLTDTLGIPLRIVRADYEKLKDFYLNKAVSVIETFESPLVRNATSYNYLCKRVSKDGFKWCLSGEGADELFGGYDYFKKLPHDQQDEAIETSLKLIHKSYLKMCDRSSMAARLEIRVPYMEQTLIDLVSQLPSNYRIRGTTDKWLLRNMFNDNQLKNIYLKPKLGMNVGAGAGSNDKMEGVFYRAIIHEYENRPERYKSDMELASSLSQEYSLDLKDLEEVFLFARFAENNYTKLTNSSKRLQLNTSYVNKR